MRGTVRKISMPRRLVADLMHASTGVPFVSLTRAPSTSARCWRPARSQAEPTRLGGDLRQGVRTGGKGTSPCCARSTPNGRWPSFYELPRSIAMVAIARVEDGQDCVLQQKVCAADTLALTEVDAQIRQAKDAPIGEVPAFRKILRVTRLPLPLRRLMWLVGLNFGRQRANWFGSFGVTSVAAYGAGELHALSPGAFHLSYGVVAPDRNHRRGDPLGSPHHRRRPDRQGPDPAGTGAEQRDRSPILRPTGSEAEPKTVQGGRDIKQTVIPGHRVSDEPEY